MRDNFVACVGDRMFRGFISVFLWFHLKIQFVYIPASWSIIQTFEMRHKHPFSPLFSSGCPITLPSICTYVQRHILSRLTNPTPVSYLLTSLYSTVHYPRPLNVQFLPSGISSAVFKGLVP